jgi:hypothetical protein
MKRSDILKQAAMVVALTVLTLGVIAVQNAPAAQGPCADDIAKYCKAAKPGGGRLAKCLKENEKQLSPACKASIEESKTRAKEARQACEGDARKFCKDVKPGEGRIVKCLRKHEKDLSPGCKAKMAGPKRK